MGGFFLCSVIVTAGLFTSFYSGREPNLLAGESSKNFWAVFGQVVAVIGAIIGTLWGGTQLYRSYFIVDFAVKAEGNCEKFSIPQTYKNKLKQLGEIATWDEIRNRFPEDSKERDSIATAVRNLLQSKAEPLDKAFTNFEDIRSLCAFTISNTGNREAQDIKLELPRTGVFSTERLGEPNKEDKFDKVIPIGKLNPGGSVALTLWTTGYDTDVDSYEQHRFRVTHTNGIVPVQFTSKTQTFIGYVYESYPTATFFGVIILFIGVMVWVSTASAAEERKKHLVKPPTETKADSVTPEANDDTPPSPS